LGRSAATKKIIIINNNNNNNNNNKNNNKENKKRSGIGEHGFRVVSDFIPNFVKIVLVFHKLKWGIHRKHNITWDYVSSLQGKKVG